MFFLFYFSGPYFDFQVYFFWVLRDFSAFEWFRTMIVQLQSELKMYQLLDQVEINVHLTGKFKQDDDIGMCSTEFLYLSISFIDFESFSLSLLNQVSWRIC